MSLYIILYILVIFFSLYIWFLFYKKYKNLSGIFFLFSLFIVSCWFIIYILTYFWFSNNKFLLYWLKGLYALSIIGIYSFLSFIYFFNKKIYSNNNTFYIIITFFIWVFSFYIFTPYIINGLNYDVIKKDYYEKLWNFFYIHLLLFFIFIISFIFIVYKKIKNLNNINIIRLKYILLWWFIFILLWFIFQTILPTFWIYIFEKEAVLFILPFLLLTWYSISRFHFSDLSFRYKEIFSFFLSIFFTIVLFINLKFFTTFLGKWFISFWWIKNTFTYTDLIMGIILYLLFYNIFIKLIPWNNEYKFFISEINDIKNRIPFITNLKTLNDFLQNRAYDSFKIKYIKIINKLDKNKEIYKFFNKNINTDVFINDIVFIEENKNKFDKEKIKKEINPKIAIIFPMYDYKNKLIWLFEIWHKPFKEQYYSEEIKIIEWFVNFLVWHLKYLNIYSKINDLNINLDKKVDKKTIEYNNLLSKQKEFISMSSHEIKTPIMASHLQIESLIDDFNSWKYNNEYINKELILLKNQISKISNLVKNIFSVQKYDIKEIWLYIEKVNINNIIISEYEILSKTNPKITFDINIEKSVKFIEIDKVQLTQVISNLLNNAVKFTNKKKPIINCETKKEWENILITIEDNWKWFIHWEEKNIFEKYFTWTWTSIGIWMWLYLCKKIVDLHYWKISVSNSEKLWWAKFMILIPIERINKKIPE